MGQVLVELGVVVVAEVGLGALPEGRALVDLAPGLLDLRLLALDGGRVLLLLEEDRVADVVGVAADEARELPRGGERVLVLLQVERDGRAAGRARRRLDREAVAAVGGPEPAVLAALGGETTAKEAPSA